MYKDRYAFPAIFDYADDGISITFPDLDGCLPCATDTDEAFKNAKEAMALHLWGMEQDKEDIPAPSDITKLELEKNQVLVMVDTIMPPIRERMNNKFVKKTLSVPNWLNVMAENEHINFSKTLQNALMEQLHINRQ